MANTKISDLTENTNPTGSEELVYAYNGTNGKMTTDTIKTFVQPDLSQYATQSDLSSYATITQLNGKQDTLTSGVTIKTVNGNSILGAGDINTSSSYTEYDYSAMQGPCATGYHIPTITEWTTVNSMGVTLSAWASGGYGGKNFGTYLKMPYAGQRTRDGNTSNQGVRGYYWTCIGSGIYSNGLNFNDVNRGILATIYKSMGFSIRPFKDTPEIPDAGRTTLFDGSGVAQNAGIFYNSTDGWISISADGETWITIQDKNLGATVVFNYGDALTSSNCGNYYQWGNNYGFAYTGALTTDSTQVDTTGYGPGNYYSSSTFITRMNSPYDWSSVENNNLWGGVTGVVLVEYDIYNRFQLTGTNITIGGQVIGGIASNELSGSYTLVTGNNNFVGQQHYLYIPTQTSSYSITLGTGVSNPFNLTLPYSTTEACLIRFYCDSVSTMIISDCSIAS